MIGWENNQGAYFINKLQAEVNSASEAADSAEQKTSAIGKMTDLLTTAKDTLVKAVNEVFNKIGNLSTLNTSSKTNLVSAINEVRYTAVNADGTANTALNKIQYLCGIEKGETYDINFNTSNADGWDNFILVSADKVSNRVGIWIVNLDSDNAIHVYPIITAGNQINITATLNTLAFKNTLSSGTGTCYVHVICLSDYGFVEANIEENEGD